MKLIKAELIVGAIVGASSAIKIGLWAIPTSVVTSLLWAMGGATGGNKLYRRLGVPTIIGVVVGIVCHSWTPLLSIPPAFGVLSIGYGIPTTQPVDEGSWLGRLCFKWSKQNEKLAEIYCRTIIYTLLALAFLPCFLVS